MKEKFMCGLGTTLGILTLCGVSAIAGFMLGIAANEFTNKDLEKEVTAKTNRNSALEKENIALKTELDVLRKL